MTSALTADNPEALASSKPKTMENTKVISHIVQQLLDVQSGKLWMGDSLERKIRSISEQEAFAKPSPTLHSVAELIAHLTAWNNDTLLKIENGTGQL